MNPSETDILHIADSSSTSTLLWLLANPFCHIALIAIAIYLQSAFPLQAYWAILPLSLTCALFLLIPNRPQIGSSQSPPQKSVAGFYPATQICFVSQGQRLVFLALFAAIPLLLGLIGVVPWYLSAYTAGCVLIIILLPDAHAKQHGANGTTETRYLRNSLSARSVRLTCVWFNLLAAMSFYILSLLWHYGAARGISCPEILGSAFASLERCLSERNTYAVLTRGHMISLVGHQINSKTLLLSSEHLHLLLLIMLLTGSLLHTSLLQVHNKLRETICDVIAIAVTGILYLSITWGDVLAERLDPALWPHRGLGLVSTAFLWLTVRLSIIRIMTSQSQQDAQSRRTISLAIPRFLSPATLAGILFFISGFLLLWHEPGVDKPGRIIIDEHHSDWEKSDLPMEAEYYGVKTLYNYAFLKEILEKHYSSVESSYQAIDEALLNDCDVLILKTPTKQYQPSEVDAIVKWVKKGGGLWLIGDHTNIFGMNTYLNQVAKAWGIRFNADAVSPLPAFYQQNVKIEGVAPYHKCGNRSHENISSAKYLNHPIIGHNIPYLTVLTSCSVSAPIDCEYITISKGTYVDHARFGSNTFFGNLTYDPDERYGSVLQNVAVKSGHGRVAVWSDSTLFSNFSMCMSGVPQLALGYANWLNKSNLISSTKYRAICICIYGLIAGTIVFWWKEPSHLIIGSLSGIILVGCLVPIVDYFNSKAYLIGNPRQGFQTIGFEEQYSSIELPNKDHVHANDPKVYEGLFVLMQRLHLMPVSADKLADALPCDAIVIINPSNIIEDEDVLRLKQHIENGHSVILMVGRNESAAAPLTPVVMRLNRLLEQVGVEDRFLELPSTVNTDLYGELLESGVFANANVSATIKPSDGCKVLLSRAEGDPIIISRPFKNGKLILCSHSDFYSNMHMGEPTEVPNARQVMILRSCYRLMHEAVGPIKDQDDFREPWKRLLSRPIDTSVKSESTPQ